VGQSYEINVAASEAWVDAFHRAHQQRFGFSRLEAAVEAVTLRASASAPVPRSPLPRLATADGPAVPNETSRVHHGGHWIEAPLHLRQKLSAGQTIVGPAIIVEYSSTTWLPPHWLATVAEFGDLLMSHAEGAD